MTRISLILVTVILCLFVSTAVVFAQDEGQPDTGTPTTVPDIFAPLTVAALGIERVIEAGWGLLESLLASSASFAFLKKEESTLDTAEKERSKAYSQMKVWVSIIVGIGLGIWAATATELKMFTVAGFSVSPTADMYLTGLVIGSGSKFTHDVVGILSELKNLVENRGGLVGQQKIEMEKKGKSPVATP